MLQEELVLKTLSAKKNRHSTILIFGSLILLVCIFSFAATSTNYALLSSIMSSAGQEKASANYQASADVMGEPFIGRSQSANFVLHSGFIPTLSSFTPQDPIDSIIDSIGNFPDDAFKSPADARRNALYNKLDAVLIMIEQGLYQDAIDKLQNDIWPKMDGSLGGNPNNDWITDPDAQQELADIINPLVIYLQTLV